ncbi:Bax inhibitor-1/YccA family protein [Gleimia sp. 6138-11-ORH1]|uniref:Bax inhibitor-1/YccA family protein n=1 Tax=Gleimia sp. 6138-11-ORH1 TaxID=2973937 RepID=UPI002167DC73|nr:Bax inhibitor-1/YccA family protein [Gleimia sp. 6138-11-ORH1]MCS4485217.1 Bax inhibitor-1/YccA family protein [Gleimia sp. 6138-11-ORH1]
MSNPIMNSVARDLVKNTPAGYPQMPGYQPGATADAATQMPRYNPADKEVTVEELNEAYFAPSADAVDTGRLTYDDIITKTGMLFGIMLLATAVSWSISSVNLNLGGALTMGSGLVGVGLVLMNSFKKKISPALIIAYAVVEGAFLGGFSYIMETMYPNVAIQGVIATVAVFATMLILFRSGKVRYSAKMAQILMIGTGGIFLYYMLNLVLQLTGVVSNPFGLSGITVFGFPLGIVIGLVAIGLGAFSLVGDFHIARYGVENGAPKVFAWQIAFGIMVTVVWLYVEIVRLLAILQSND